MRLILLCCLALTSLSTFANGGTEGQREQKLSDAITATSPGPTCPNPKKLKHFCMYVDGKQDDPKPLEGYNFVYQRKLLEAACVDVEKDSEQVVGEKVRQMWKQYEDQLVCNSLRFDVQNGNVVKFASILMFDAFIRDVARWKVDLNRVDRSDGMTVLDYIKANIERSKNTATEKKLVFYYDLLRKAGAKHKSEL